jgi:hypothetical protein
VLGRPVVVHPGTEKNPVNAGAVQSILVYSSQHNPFLNASLACLVLIFRLFSTEKHMKNGESH